MLGAFLENLDTPSNNNHWYHHTPYLQSYSTLANQLLQLNTSSEISAWPTAYPALEDNSVTVQPNDIIVPNFNLPEEIHNEDSLCSRLAAGFLCSADEIHFPYQSAIRI